MPSTGAEANVIIVVRKYQSELAIHQKQTFSLTEIDIHWRKRVRSEPCLLDVSRCVGTASALIMTIHG